MDGAQRVYLKESSSGSLSETNSRVIFIASKSEEGSPDSKGEKINRRARRDRRDLSWKREKTQIILTKWIPLWLSILRGLRPEDERRGSRERRGAKLEE